MFVPAYGLLCLDPFGPQQRPLRSELFQIESTANLASTVTSGLFFNYPSFLLRAIPKSDYNIIFLKLTKNTFGVGW